MLDYRATSQLGDLTDDALEGAHQALEVALEARGTGASVVLRRLAEQKLAKARVDADAARASRLDVAARALEELADKYDAAAQVCGIPPHWISNPHVPGEKVLGDVPSTVLLWSPGVCRGLSAS